MGTGSFSAFRKSAYTHFSYEYLGVEDLIRFTPTVAET